MLSRHLPESVTHLTIEEYLKELGQETGSREALASLVRTGWLKKTKIRGVYAFIPLADSDFVDSYIELKGYKQIHPEAIFYLAGVSAAWCLGYLDREPLKPMIWIQSHIDLPKNLRASIETVTIPFATTDHKSISPSFSLLRKRNLDVVKWSKGLPAFGPEALLVQMASRPATFKGWIDLAGKIKEFVSDIDFEKLLTVSQDLSAASCQRMSYILKLGGLEGSAKILPRKLSPTRLGKDGPSHWDAETMVIDHLIQPMMNAHAKA